MRIINKQNLQSLYNFSRETFTAVKTTVPAMIDAACTVGTIYALPCILGYGSKPEIKALMAGTGVAVNKVTQAIFKSGIQTVDEKLNLNDQQKMQLEAQKRIVTALTIISAPAWSAEVYNHFAKMLHEETWDVSSVFYNQLSAMVYATGIISIGLLSIQTLKAAQGIQEIPQAAKENPYPVNNPMPAQTTQINNALKLDAQAPI